jgi:ribosomal protein S18 acetylase RimI-like enzyme
VLEVRTATLEDVPRIAETMASAMHGEAMLHWSFGTEGFATRIRRHFAHFDGELTRRGWFRLVEDGAGAAVWIPPDQREEEETITPAPPGEEEEILGGNAERWLAFWTWVEHHRPEEPHAYLSHIGVHPSRQGRGLGTTLMRDGVERSDAAGVPIWLETSTARNAAYYLGFGFRTVVDEDAPDGGPHIWFMRRDPS